MPSWCCKRLLAKTRCGWGGWDGDWCGPQYENHNVRLGSDGAEKACGVKASERHHETLVPSPRRACARWAGAGSNAMETVNVGRQVGRLEWLCVGGGCEVRWEGAVEKKVN
jgi:hypothetical protein